MEPSFVQKPIYHRENHSFVWFLIILLLGICLFFWWWNILSYLVVESSQSFKGNHTEKLPEVLVMTKHAIIAHIAYEASLAGIDPIKALQIAKKESQFNPMAKNPKSTARGLFQIISSTWRYCGGNINDPEDNTACFIKLFPKHPEYWR